MSRFLERGAARVTFSVVLTCVMSLYLVIAALPGALRLTSPVFCRGDLGESVVVFTEAGPVLGHYTMYCVGAQGEFSDVGFLWPWLALSLGFWVFLSAISRIPGLAGWFADPFGRRRRASANVQTAALLDPGFDPPAPLAGDDWRLEPLGAEHNDGDHAAWTGSMEHIRATPGFAGRPWPHPMTLEENLGDLVAHADGFAARKEFTYSVLIGDEVVGCVYVMSDAQAERADAAYMRCWVTSEHAAMDGALREAVTDWLRSDWPFSNVRVDEVAA